MTAVDVLVTGTTKAVCLILQERGINHNDYTDKLWLSVKAVLRDNFDGIMSEWKEATQAMIGEAWLRELVNAQCIEMALKAIDHAGL